MQARVKCIAEIISQLFKGVEAGADVDLNLIKREATQKFKVKSCIMLDTWFNSRACSR